MSKLSRGQALVELSRWNNQDVLSFLRKNNLEKCCQVIETRKIDGEALLRLTEGELARWKNDLSRPLKWQLWSLIDELAKTPEKYVEKQKNVIENEEDTNENTSWDSDFGDEEYENVYPNVNVFPTAANTSTPVYVDAKKLPYHDQSSHLVNGNQVKVRTSAEIFSENIYSNCDSAEEPDCRIYEEAVSETEEEKASIENGQKVSCIRNQLEKKLKEDFKEQLSLVYSKTKNVKRPSSDSKLKETKNNGENEVSTQKTQKPRRSFLHAKTTEGTNVIKRMTVAPPPEPKKSDKVNENSSRGIIRNFDLVVNLPTKTEESDDEYESYNDSSLSLTNADSKLSINSNATDNIYRPCSIASYDEDCIDKIYESINDTHIYEDDDENIPNVVQQIPPDLPPKLFSCPSLQSLNSNSSKTSGLGVRLADELSDMIVKIKRASSSSHLNPPELPERSPDKKYVLPHSSSTVSLPSIDRASRPLPTLPDKNSYTDKPWFHNVSREQATIMIKDQSTYGNTNQNGYFLLRPSSTSPTNPLVLVLWYNDRVYNVQVRKRPDKRFALGSSKPNEQSFTSLDELVSYYKREELILYTSGVQMGSTKLTDTPFK